MTGTESADPAAAPLQDDGGDMVSRLQTLIRENGVARDDQRRKKWAEVSPKTSDSSWEADFIIGEQSGFAIWLGSLDDALDMKGLHKEKMDAILNCATDDCEVECLAFQRRAGAGRRRSHARGSSIDDGFIPEDRHAESQKLDRDQVRALAVFNGSWYTSMLGKEVAFLGIGAEDTEGYNMKANFGETSAFLRQCRKEGRKVLVHCVMGINRSSTALVAFLCQDLGMDLVEAINLVSKNRGHILSNKSFVQQLIDTYDKKGASAADHPEPEEDEPEGL